MPAETLIDRLWDSRPPSKARESLSVYVTRLRGALRQALGDRVHLVGRDRGYVLDIEPESVDLHQFRRLRRQAGALAASGDHDHAAQLLREADGLWCGEALAGVRGDWISRMRDSLQEERRAAILERVECELELDRHADLVGELHHLLAQYPLDETLTAHQMTALYWSGRPGDALDLYRETRRRLIEVQGAEPGPTLSTLHLRILRRDPALAVRPAASHASQVSRPPDTLPAETVEFVGRSDELAQLTKDAGEGSNIVVIEGMPGVGKTALAVRAARAVAEQYPDGVLYLNLHSHDPAGTPLDPAEALHALLRMLNVSATHIPEALGERVALWRAQLGRRRAVVILDDAGRHDQVRPLLPVAGRCLFLITTRRRLTDLDGARTLTLDVLSVDDAVALFRQVGRTVAQDTEEVAKAVGLCGRLPLAVQLAAGRISRDHPIRLTDLTEELSHSPAQLGGAGAASTEVMSAFDLSYRALEPDHQLLFRRLGMSPCALASPQAAAALADCTLAEAEKAIGTLLDHHLLARAPGGRFRFHDLIRGYAAMRAARDDPEPEQRQAVARLLDYYLYAADKADRILHPFRYRMPVPVAQQPSACPPLGTQDDAASWLEAEWRNILQAAQHAGQHEWKRKCADLTHVVAGFLETSAYWDEAIAAHTLALQACRDLCDPARIAHASLDLSSISQQTGRHEETLPLASDSATIYRSLADRRGEAEALDQIGMAHQRAARSREALAYFSEARTLYAEVGNHHGLAGISSHSGIACWHLGRYPEATAHLQEALALYREVGDRRGEAKTLNNLGRMQLYCGYHRDALDCYQQSLVIFKEIGGSQNQAILYHNIGGVHHYKGSHQEGLAAYRRALAIYRELGDLPDEADVLNDIGSLYQGAACYDEALIHHQKARMIAEEIGSLSQQVIALRKIADIRRGSGQHNAAFEDYHAALRMAREIGDPYEEAKILEGIAESTLNTQRPYDARILFRQALDIFERLGVPEAQSARIRIETMAPAAELRVS